MNNDINILERFIAETALQNLDNHTGIKGKWIPIDGPGDNGVDGKIDLYFENRQLRFNAEVKTELRHYHFDKLIQQARNHEPLMVIAGHIFPTLKDRLRQEGIAYMDKAGNIFMKQEGYLIWLDGRKTNPENKQPHNRAFTKTGLKVIFTFFYYPEAVNLPYREIAALANVALGTITAVMAGLKETGYLLQLNHGKVKLIKKRELWERWLTGYREILKPGLLLGTYQIKNVEAWQNLVLPENTCWGGEPAAELLTEYLNPEILTIYIEGTNRNTLIKNLRMVPKGEGNVKVYRRFWNDQHPVPLAGTAPIMITYADLLITEDQRCIEAAEIIYNKYLKELFHEQ